MRTAVQVVIEVGQAGIHGSSLATIESRLQQTRSMVALWQCHMGHGQGRGHGYGHIYG
jgi:hypothetical protein